MDIILSNAHSSYAKGASGDFGGKLYAEYDLSASINKLLYDLLIKAGFTTTIIDASHITPYSKSLEYKAKAISDYTPKVAVETHFNAGPNVVLSKVSCGMEIVYTDRHTKQCELLAQCCMQSMIHSLPFKIRRDGSGLYKHNKIYLLNTVTCPIIIVEVCFITHPIDRLFLLHPRAIDIIANSLCTGIINFLKVNKGE